jgi:hypothetical protein
MHVPSLELSVTPGSIQNLAVQMTVAS